LGDIDIASIWQQLRKRSVEKVLVFHGKKIRPVYPDQIDGATVITPGGLLRQHP
jgi:hypothetical protein